MPRGKRTYGSKVGRPSNKAKAAARKKMLNLPPMPPKRKRPKNVQEAIMNYGAKSFYSEKLPPTPIEYKKKVEQIKNRWKKKSR
tara:strand:- start:284 stop:535 length:252 start_codon:yes stop_codon:yes gene_type:complete